MHALSLHVYVCLCMPHTFMRRVRWETCVCVCACVCVCVCVSHLQVPRASRIVIMIAWEVVELNSLES